MTLPTTGRLAYDDASTPAEMNADCLAAQAVLATPTLAPVRSAAARLSLEQGKQEIEIPEAAARLARAIYGDG